MQKRLEPAGMCPAVTLSGICGQKLCLARFVADRLSLVLM